MSSDARGVDRYNADRFFLSLVGLPHAEVFTFREDLEGPYHAALDAITLGSRFDHYGIPRPAESQSGWTLGYLFTSLIALDPASAKVYGFPEGSSDYLPLLRDVESLVYALIEFRKLEVDHDSDVDPEELRRDSPRRGPTAASATTDRHGRTLSPQRSRTRRPGIALARASRAWNRLRAAPRSPHPAPRTPRTPQKGFLP